ncbi:MAG: Thymidylate synthase thyX [uncultured Thermomicrobiales bacterium]|uniref:Thymidylate synthase thyX n=1 Tax=uncultured Thermomicrobiales bacterium TaxID=1645740 RepID=A0A6J4UEF5_9BACT|nr:MAG: Thymidylate synthase thyX [uncultured Thermomicrobiales bacterium]
MAAPVLTPTTPIAAATDVVPDLPGAQFASPPPTVTLLREESARHPVALAIAAAWSCYGGKPARVENVRKLLHDPPSPTLSPAKVAERAERRERALALYADLFAAGHHTTLQHATFVFVLDNVSRLAIWSFFHAHPHYNSEQVSQRYREVSGETMVTPTLPEPEAAIYRAAIARSLEGYRRLTEILAGDVRDRYASVFPARAKARGEAAERRMADAVQKRAQEVARYVLPLATPAHLYHTVNGLTLLRYHALASQADAPAEVRLIVAQMVAAVLEVDPYFLGGPGHPLDLRPLLAEETLESLALAAWRETTAQGEAETEAFCRRFDEALDGHESRLVGYDPDAERTMADAVRAVVGLDHDALPDEAALRRVLDGGENPYQGHPLFLGMHSKLMQTMSHVPFTFAKRISGAEDAQNQRHRGTVGSRPLLTAHLRREPDVITPWAIRENPAALAEYEATVGALWEAKNALLDRGVAPEVVLYLLPNSHRVRFYESGTLLDYYWKWVKRLCYDAQREIFDTARDEVAQVRAVLPTIGRYVDGPPCVMRSRAGATPVCPEGERFCGVPVWRDYAFETLGERRVL